MIETELLNKNDIQNDSEFWANLEFEQAKRKNRKITGKINIRDD